MTAAERARDAVRRTLAGKPRQTAKINGVKSCRFINPPPPEFVTVFERGGWEAVEAAYKNRTDSTWKHKLLTGAQCRRPKKRRAA
jgi:hypothetical protein